MVISDQGKREDGQRRGADGGGPKSGSEREKRSRREIAIIIKGTRTGAERPQAEP